VPKRRITTAAQSAAARRNLERARQSTKLRTKLSGQTGKNVLMVHHTSAKAKAGILKDQAFKPHPHQANTDHVFVTPYSNRHDPTFRGKYGYGYTGVKVLVPRKAVKQDSDWPHPQSFMVDKKALQGKKIRGLDRQGN